MIVKANILEILNSEDRKKHLHLPKPEGAFAATKVTFIWILVTLALIAVFVVYAMPAASNAALPEFRYNAKGEKLSMLGSPGAIFETKAGAKITCEGWEATAKFAKPSPTNKIESIDMEFSGCKGFGVACTTPGALKAGLISFKTLSAEIGYIVKATKEVGILIEGPGGGELGKFECGAMGESKVKGSFIGSYVAPDINKPVFVCGGWTLEWKQTASKQEPEKFEGGAVSVLMASLNAGAFEVTGFDSGIFFRGNEVGREIELKA